VLEALHARLSIPLSVDTSKAEVAERALALGAVMVNDVTALSSDPELGSVVAARRAALVLMHHRGRSAQMYDRAQYQDVAREVRTELQERIDAAVAAGIPRECLLIDPGIGFAKRAAQSLEVLAALPALGALDRPLLVGPSRKSFLQAALGDVPPGERVWGTAAAVTAAVLWGAHVVRVHDLPQMRDVVRVADSLRMARSTSA
jgi:dihydropteroate synthase